jgi:DNA-binding response OmpR family regulator
VYLLNILVVEKTPARGAMLAILLERLGWQATCATSASDALAALDHIPVSGIVLNLDIPGDAVLSIPVYAGYRQPDACVLVLSGSGLFHDGSIFRLCSNACAFMGSANRPEDIVAVLDHHARRGAPVRTPAWRVRAVPGSRGAGSPG